MTDATKELESYGRDIDRVLTPITLEELDARQPVDLEAAVGARLRRAWVPAVVAGLAILIVVGGASILFGGSDGSVAPVAPVESETPAPMPDSSESSMTAMSLLEMGWQLENTEDDWLVPLAFRGSYFAVRTGVDDDSREAYGGELLVSEDGVLWEEMWPPLKVPSDEHVALATDGNALFVRFAGGDIKESSDGYSWEDSSISIAGFNELDSSAGPKASETQLVVDLNPTGVLYEMQVPVALRASDDGTTWREIVLPPTGTNWVPEIAGGEWGWLVYSPPIEASVASDGQSAYQGPRPGNLGLWYTPDTHTWHEVADLGPLVDAPETMINDGGLQVIDISIEVRDTDAVVYARIADNLGFGTFSQLRTEIWRLAPGSQTPSGRGLGEVFDLAAHDLCDWFSPEEINEIVTSAYEQHGVEASGESMTRRQDRYNACFWSGNGVVVLGVDNDDRPVPDASFERHPSLDDSVRAATYGDGSYGLTWGLDALIEVDGRDEQLRFGHIVWEAAERDIEMTNSVGLTIVNTMLHEMGWLNDN